MLNQYGQTFSRPEDEFCSAQWGLEYSQVSPHQSQAQYPSQNQPGECLCGDAALLTHQITPTGRMAGNSWNCSLFVGIPIHYTRPTFLLSALFPVIFQWQADQCQEPPKNSRDFVTLSLTPRWCNLNSLMSETEKHQTIKHAESQAGNHLSCPFRLPTLLILHRIFCMCIKIILSIN